MRNLLRAAGFIALVFALLLCTIEAAHARIVTIGRGTAVTATTTATAADDTTVANGVARYVTICSPSDATATVYVGSSAVTSATGLPLAAGKCWSSGERVDADVQAYVIVASGTQAVRVQETL